MTENQANVTPAAPIAVLAPAMRIEMVHVNEKDDEKDSIEFGPANMRAKVYGCSSRPAEFMAKCQEMKKMMIALNCELDAVGLSGAKKGKAPGE